jgi:hypothetical protein
MFAPGKFRPEFTVRRPPVSDALHDIDAAMTDTELLHSAASIASHR